MLFTINENVLKLKMYI